MFKYEKIRKGINIVFSIAIITLFLFSGIIFPNVYLSVEETLSQELNLPIVIILIIVFSSFIMFNSLFIFNKTTIIKEEVQEVEKESTSE